jgi:hypothetical protein
MPIFRINGQLHFFAHAPKCGGSAVEVYLAERFGPLALTEMRHHLLADRERWNRTAAQHIPQFTLDRLVPADWFASSFAVVRHPLRRLYSAFFYARDVGKTLPVTIDFNAWFKEAATWIAVDPFRHGGHFLPQSAYIAQAARIFRLEDGLDAIVPYLDGLAGSSDGPRHVPSVNVGRWRGEEAPPVPTEETLTLVTRVYAADFARFGYLPVLTTEAASALPDLPVTAATGAPPEPTKRTFTQRLLRKLQAKVENG